VDNFFIDNIKTICYAMSGLFELNFTKFARISHYNIYSTVAQR